MERVQQIQNELEKVWGSLSERRAPLVCAKVAGRMVARTFFTASACAQWVARMEGPGINFYVQLNPADVHDRKARSDEIIAPEAILIDIDPCADEAIPEIALTYVRNYLPQFTYSVIYTGRGYQLWLHLEGLEFDTDSSPSRREWEAAVCAFFRCLDSLAKPGIWGCKLDTCTSDVSRLARLPGSLHGTTGKMAQVISVHAKRLNAYQFFTQYEVPVVSSTTPVTPIAGEWNLRKALAHLSAKACQFLTGGWVSPGRRAAVFATAASLAEAGLPETVAWEWVNVGNEMCKPKPLSRAQLAAPFDNGWKRGLEKHATTTVHKA